MLASTADAATSPQVLNITAGAQQELVVEKGVERIALADETVANITITRQQKNSPAARLLITGKAPGSTTLLVWEKGSSVATSYAIEVARRSLTIEGTFNSLPEQRAAADAKLASYPKDAPVTDRSVVAVRSDTVQVEVKIVEFSRNVLKEIGFNLSKLGPNSHGFSFQTTPASNGSITDAFALAFGFGKANNGSGASFTLNLLESNGLARILAEPTLVAMSGQSASFLSGGELPILVPQGLGTTVIQFKPFGIGLTVTPTVLANDRIALKVAPEASDLDYSNAVVINDVSVPAITTRRADTAVELGDGESFIIGGLVSRSTISNASKVPLLGDLPVIGNFFKQTSYTMSEKELVIIVTPRLVRPIARGVDLAGSLPGGAEQRDGPVWRTMMVGGIGGGSVLPGFSK
ncbi:type II and III secretion system protein family protein [soil metagenome]